jgi:hypothetical protein
MLSCMGRIRIELQSNIILPITVQTSAGSLVTREFVESSLEEEKQMNVLFNQSVCILRQCVRILQVSIVKVA